jgi:NAD(P)H-dependent flavin oxidoreductase YrpB (nitropropane dioxygenase family)
MFDTRITRQFGLAAPVINAGMAFVAGPELAAAVCNAGGLGMLGGALVPPEGLKVLIEATRKLTDRRFGVDMIGDFSSDAHVDVLIEGRVALAVFFWTAPTPTQIARMKSARIAFWMQVGSVEEARAASKLGAEALVVQGSEGGGHNRAEATLANLLPAVRAALPDMPLVAAGGITDGASMVAAFARGAEAVWCGTRFLASREADAHDGYKARVVAAKSGETALTRVFGPEWPDQPLRALVNEAVRRSAGREKAALAEAAGDIIGTTQLGGQAVPVPRYSALLPTRAFEADLEWSCLTAGESAANIQSVEPAGAILKAMMREGELLLSSLGRTAA